MITMKLIALRDYSMPTTNRFCLKNSRMLPMLTLCALLSACATPQPPNPKAVYDFGAATQSITSTASRTAAVALPEVEAGAGLDSPALLYRLLYADDQQLRPYAQARWSVPPAQLVRARLRDALASLGPVLSTEGIAPWALRVELDEFSQVFASESSSQGLVRLRASLFKGEQLAAQTTMLARAAAPTQDAAGGVRALTAATDDAVRQLSAWLATQIKP
jgi:cholesterol transport system auxiliary component